MKPLAMATGLLLEAASFAGEIRSVDASQEKMEHIYLKLGQSTVLRFEETPRRIVVGNANYFNIEFIGQDITVQPQAPVTTNLFVYGKRAVYGFILHVGEGSHYDDLVNVRRKPPTTTEGAPRKKTENKGAVVLDDILFYPKSITPLRRGLFVLGFTLTNQGTGEAKTQDIGISLSVEDAETFGTSPVYSKNAIGTGETAEGRLFFRPSDGGTSFTLRLRYKGKEAAFTASKRPL